MERPRREGVSVEALKEAGLRQNTLRAADGAVRHFEQTFGGLLPASPTAMADYIAFSLEEGLAVSTVGQRVSLLGTWHEEMGYPNPNQDSLVKTVLKGARSHYRKAPKKAVPLSRDHLVRVVQACDDAIVAASKLDDPKQHLAQTRSAGRDKAFFLLGFWCAFRSDELVNLRWEYLTFGEGRDAKTGRPIRTLEVFLPASKGDRGAEGRSWTLHEMSELCPVTALFDWRAAMMADEGPVFVKIGRWGHASDAPLHINSVLELMKRAIAQAGMDASGFSTHSLRRGFANHAIDRNTDVRDLMDWVKWKDIRSAVAYLEANQRLANTLAEIDQDMPPTVSVLKPERLRSAGQSASVVAAQSRGTIYQVVNEKVLDTYWRQLRPNERDELPEGLPLRALNVALSRDSKGFDHSHGIYYLLLKGSGTGVTWSNGHSTLKLSDATRNYGAATLGIRIEDDWTSDRPLWLVENQNLFDNLDWLPDGTVASVAYYGGQLSNLLIEWLAKTPRARKVILFPDYDGIGLMNYARLRAELTEDCEFWLMPDWSRLLEKYGNPKVWLDNLDSFEAAYDRLYDGADQALIQLMETMRKQAMALEQEAIWLTTGE